jgi:hypothetical protein
MGVMRISHGHGPAGEPPTPEQLEQWHRRMSPPENEFPAAVGLTALLGRTDDAAVGITKFEAFSTGFQFTLAVRLRRARPELARGGLLMLLDPHHPGIEIPLPKRLLLGLEYSDGRRASTLQDIRTGGPLAVPGGQELTLAQHGGSGGDRSADETFWVSPLPPTGPVTFVLAWPAFDIPESRTVLDSAPIRAAADHSQLLWPPQPAEEPAQPPPPPRPSSGWFAEPSD